MPHVELKFWRKALTQVHLTLKALHTMFLCHMWNFLEKGIDTGSPYPYQWHRRVPGFLPDVADMWLIYICLLVQINFLLLSSGNKVGILTSVEQCLGMGKSDGSMIPSLHLQ